jgi:hypothetical protein
LENYKFENTKLFYGIEYTNTLSINNKYKKVWLDSTELLNNINLTFTLNTKENILNPADKDYGIVEITEMGLFNKAGELIAYCTHPKVQYRSCSQHISYTLIIKEIT